MLACVHACSPSVRGRKRRVPGRRPNAQSQSVEQTQGERQEAAAFKVLKTNPNTMARRKAVRAAMKLANTVRRGPHATL